MPIDIFGFIEVARFDDNLENADSWNFCVDIMPFLLLADDICAVMFGVAKCQTEWHPIAGSRGAPPSVGRVGKKMIREVIREAMPHRKGDRPYGCTYITYEELKQINWLAYPGADLKELAKPYGWYSLFKTMDALNECFLAQRLVVWFQW